MAKQDLVYADYFSKRGIESDFYDSRKGLPEYLKRVLPEDKKARILDIGCGLGHMLLALRELGYDDLTGIDISSGAVSSCQEKGLDVRKIEDINSYCRASPERFDLIIMSHVLEHLEKGEIIGTLASIRTRILRDGAALCVMVPNAQSNTGCYWAYEDFTHSLLFTAGSLGYVLRSAGYTNIQFLDVDGLSGTRFPFKTVKRLLLGLYVANRHFWNRVTLSSYHEPSPQIYTFEIKALAKQI